MNNLNSILIEGNLVRDPELSYTPKGTALCKFIIECHRQWKQEEEIQREISFFGVSTWSRLAEVCAEYLKKGRGVRVVGRLKQDRWTDPNGKPQSQVLIIAEHVEFKPQSFRAEAPKDNESLVANGAEALNEDEEEGER